MSGRGRPPSTPAAGATGGAANSQHSPSHAGGGGDNSSSERPTSRGRGITASRGRGRPPLNSKTSPQITRSNSSKDSHSADAGNHDKESSGGGRTRRKNRRPRVQTNPPAPDIVEKRAPSPSRSSRASSNSNSCQASPSKGSSGEPAKSNGHDEATKLAQEVSGLMEDIVSKIEDAPPVEDSFESLIEKSSVVIDTDDVDVVVANGSSDKPAESPSGNGGGDPPEPVEGSNVLQVVQCLRETLSQAVNGEELGFTDLKSRIVAQLKDALGKVETSSPGSASTLRESVSSELASWLESSEPVERLLQIESESKSESQSHIREELVTAVMDEALPMEPVSEEQQQVVCMIENAGSAVVVLEDITADMASQFVIENVAMGSPRKKAPLAIDKSKLFSHMEDKFAKETQNVLKNKPTYKKRSSDSHSQPRTPIHSPTGSTPSSSAAVTPKPSATNPSSSPSSATTTTTAPPPTPATTTTTATPPTTATTSTSSATPVTASSSLQEEKEPAATKESSNIDDLDPDNLLLIKEPGEVVEEVEAANKEDKSDCDNARPAAAAAVAAASPKTVNEPANDDTADADEKEAEEIKAAVEAMLDEQEKEAAKDTLEPADIAETVAKSDEELLLLEDDVSMTEEDTQQHQPPPLLPVEGDDASSCKQPEMASSPPTLPVQSEQQEQQQPQQHQVSTTGSELTKSLRKVRVRRSRTSSGTASNENDAPPMPQLTAEASVTAADSSSLRDSETGMDCEPVKEVSPVPSPIASPSSSPVTPLAQAATVLMVDMKGTPGSKTGSPAKVIRPKLVLSPRQENAVPSSSSSASPPIPPLLVSTSTSGSGRRRKKRYSEPLKIEIPEPPVSSAAPTSLGYNSLLMTTPSEGSDKYAERKQDRPSRHAKPSVVIMSEAYITKEDATFAALAFARRSKDGAGPAVDVTKVPRIVLNGGNEIVSSSSPSASGAAASEEVQPPLKTVIRVPKKTTSRRGKRRHHGSSIALSDTTSNHDQADLDTDEEDVASSSAGLNPRRKKRKMFLSSSMPRGHSPRLAREESPLAPGTADSSEDAISLEGFGAEQGNGHVSGQISTTNSALITTPIGGSLSAGGKQANEASSSTAGSGNTEKMVAADSMVVPEKASSFKIHPDRCCSDTCHYCTRKFGMLDTPMHVSQLKNIEAQSYACSELNMTRDSCLCDFCFRRIDRNYRNQKNKQREQQRESVSADTFDSNLGPDGKPRTNCIVKNCNREVVAHVQKRWFHRFKKKLFKRMSINWDRVSKGSAKTSFPLCTKHNAVMDNYRTCKLCGRKLTVAACVPLGHDRETVARLNEELRADAIQADLSESVLLCKLCKSFCSFKLKADMAEYLKNNKQHKLFYREYRKKLQGNCYDNEFLSEPAIESPKKIHQVSSQSDNPTKITIKTTTLDVGTTRKRKHNKEFLASPSSESRIHVATDCDDDPANQPTASTSDAKAANLTPGPSGAVASSSSTSTHQGASASAHQGPSSSGPSDPSKCSVNIQFDLNTKKLWQDLHFPYGTYTSFFRHLILLEKYWRNGDLTLSKNASQKASVYVRSVKNRIDAYEGKHAGSEDLSASTRPDLSVPAAPKRLHLPDGEDDGENVQDTSTRPNPKLPSPMASTPDSSTILKIPKVPKPNTSQGEASSAATATVTTTTTSTSSTAGSTSSTSTSTTPSSMPTKIRVRKDLMHLGLMARGTEPNLMSSDPEAMSVSPCSSPQSSPQKKESFNIRDIMAPSVASSSSSSSPGKANNSKVQSNLLQLLNEPLASTKRGPLLGNTALIASKPSSGSTATSTTSTSKSTAATVPTSSSTASSSSSEAAVSGTAIPLTFNNSIAEVLAAHAAQTKAKAAAAAKEASQQQATSDLASDLAAASTSKPEVTITAKPSPGSKTVSVSRLPPTANPLASSAGANKVNLLGISNIRPYADLWGADASGVDPATAPAAGLAKSSSVVAGSAQMKSASPSGGGSIQKKTSSSSSSSSSSAAAAALNSLHPLADMNKLLQSQNPGLAPHIVAQSTLPTSVGGVTKPSNVGALHKPVPQKIVAKPGPMPTNIRPVQLNKPSAVQQSPLQQAQQQSSLQSKKSLNTVLDRLSGLSSSSGASAATATSSPSRSSSSTPSAGPSSLVQQLNAPPLASKSNLSTAGSKAKTSTSASTASSKNSSSSSSSSSNSAAAAAVNAMAMQQQFNSLFGLNPTGFVGQPMVQYPNAWMNQAQAQAAALLMASTMGSLPGMQAAAVQEFMLKNMQQQASAASSTTTSAAAAAASRNQLRAPPPLTHMGRSSTGGSGTGSGSGGSASKKGPGLAD